MAGEQQQQQQQQQQQEQLATISMRVLFHF
jgi:hypothetical protein